MTGRRSSYPSFLLLFFDMLENMRNGKDAVYLNFPKPFCIESKFVAQIADDKLMAAQMLELAYEEKHCEKSINTDYQHFLLPLRKCLHKFLV